MPKTDAERIAELRTAIAKADADIAAAEAEAWADGEPTMSQRAAIADTQRARRRLNNALTQLLGHVALREQSAPIALTGHDLGDVEHVDDGGEPWVNVPFTFGERAGSLLLTRREAHELAAVLLAR
ncbi:hypothetical protein [Microbacterium arborescens]|uniref:hypothetical protein n=1 Tax=Microbacterium arborescens TaxID=33883 RepID=UPI000DF86A99|nr:hypothetical protein [Microbacterium arborescens]